jgi:hypothetical protein
LHDCDLALLVGMKKAVPPFPLQSSQVDFMQPLQLHNGGVAPLYYGEGIKNARPD